MIGLRVPTLIATVRLSSECLKSECGMIACVGAPLSRFIMRSKQVQNLRIPPWLVPSALVLGSAWVLHRIQILFRDRNEADLPGGYLLQEWPSEQMMQNLGLADMFAFGPMSLWYKHIYPPLQDAFRYFFSLPELVHGFPPHYAAVDLNLYKLYALCFGVVNGVIYLWVRSATGNGWLSGAVTLLWAISPGYLTCMMLLDPTPLALAGISISFYLLYLFLKTRQLWFYSAFSCVFFLSSLARSFTQIHVLIFVVAMSGAAIFLARRRSLLAVCVLLLGVSLLWVLPGKQQSLYGTWDTSTFGGHIRSGTLGLDPHSVPEPEFSQEVLKAGEVFESKWNTTDALRDHIRLSEGANAFVISNPVAAIQGAATSLTITVPEMLRPTSSYVDNFLVAEMSWKSAYDWVFSSWRYILIIALSISTLFWAYGRQGFRRWLQRYGWFLTFYALIAAPLFFSNRFIVDAPELGPVWTDAVRLKIFLEVPLVVLLAVSLWSALQRLREIRRVPRGTST